MEEGSLRDILDRLSPSLLERGEDCRLPVADGCWEEC
jgi:hypothetical protein